MNTITLLGENTARGAGILGEHGLAWWIDTEAFRQDARAVVVTHEPVAVAANCIDFGARSNVPAPGVTRFITAALNRPGHGSVAAFHRAARRARRRGRMGHGPRRSDAARILRRHLRWTIPGSASWHGAPSIVL